MKANLKGTSGIKSLLLLHGEKIGIAVVGLLAVLFIYRSIDRAGAGLDDSYRHTALQQKVQQTRTTVMAADFDRAREEHPDEVPIAKDIERSASLDVPADLYAISGGFDPPVITPTVPRTDPVLLPAADVVVYGGYGRFAFEDDQVRRERRLEEEREQERQQRDRERQVEQQQQRGERGRPARGRGEDELGRGMPIDPRFPDRRPLETAGIAQGGLALDGFERVDQATWACIVAKVPIREQLRQHRDAFENAKGGWLPSDFPEYVGFAVERAEVTPGQDELQWQRVPVHDAQASREVIAPTMTARVLHGPLPGRRALYEIIAEDWAGGQPMEVVDPNHLDPNRLLVYPLPPLVGREWGADATHPDIPLAVDAVQPPEEAVEERMLTAEEGEAPEIDLFGRPAGGRTGIQPSGPAGFHGPGPRMRPEMGGPGRFQSSLGLGRHEGLGQGVAGERGMHAVAGYGTGRGGAMSMLPRGVNDWLLRFFDFTVEPGKKYKYRVQLILQDPNRNPNLPPDALDSSVVNRIREARRAAGGRSPHPIRYTAWSEPSPTVGIPLMGGVRVADARAPSRVNDEPAVTLLVDAIDIVEGQPKQAAVEEELRRGYVANLENEAKVVTVDGRYYDPVRSFQFRTGVTVLDVKGGEDFSRDLRAPARVLLMDPSGELYVRNELDDLAEVERHRMIFEEPDWRGRGAPGEMMFPRGERAPPRRGP